MSSNVNSQRLHLCDGNKVKVVVFLQENHSNASLPYNRLCDNKGEQRLQKQQR